MCRHLWHHASLDRAQCRLCGLELQRIEPKRRPKPSAYELGRRWYPWAMLVYAIK